MTHSTLKSKSDRLQSGSDPSLHLSEGSSLSSDSDIPVKKTKKKKNSKRQYCICRRGYDGKEFMIECEKCKEWFHGDCIGLKPNSVTDHYYCDACKKPLIIIPPTLPTLSKLSIHEEDEDDICVLCDGDCTCMDETPQPALPPPPPPPPQQPASPKPALQTKIIIPIPKKRIGKSVSKSKKYKRQQQQRQQLDDSSDGSCSSSNSSSSSSSSSSEEEEEEEEVVIEEKRPKPKKGKKLISKLPLIKSSSDEDEEVIIDDLDDLLETMSPLSDHSASSDNSLALEEEFFTDDEDANATTPSSVHIDSGDDEDIEDEETKQIIQDFGQSDSEDEELEDSDDGDSEEEPTSYMYVEDEEDDEEEEEIPYGYSNHWSSDDEEEDMDEEIEFDYMTADSDEQQNPFLPLLDSEGNLYDNIASAFTQTGVDNTSFAELLNTLAVDQRNEDMIRRPSLPSNALSAAQRMRGSQDMNTSETLRALSNVDLSLFLNPIEEEKEQETIDLSVLVNLLKSNQDNVNKRKAAGVMNDISKRRKSRSHSLSALEQPLQPLETNSFSMPASPAAIIDEIEDMLTNEEEEEEGGGGNQEEVHAVSMDDLVDTSQLYSRSLSPELETENPYSKDLSRWQRIPIGAFRLMRSKNKLWLER